MGLGIKEIVVDSLSIDKDTEGNRKVEGYYKIISSNDTILAKQSFNGYSDIKVNFSPETLTALNAFLAGAKKDVSVTVLGE